jgi:hypothetical protein
VYTYLFGGNWLGATARGVHNGSAGKKRRVIDGAASNCESGSGGGLFTGLGGGVWSALYDVHQLGYPFCDTQIIYTLYIYIYIHIHIHPYVMKLAGFVRLSWSLMIDTLPLSPRRFLSVTPGTTYHMNHYVV